MYDLIVIGGGAAGILSAIGAAISYKEQGKPYKIVLLEKNEKLGKKLFITGKGRCNITNACDIEDFFMAVKSNPKFLYSAVYTFSNDSIVELIEKYGTRTKIERGGRVFPVSDHSSDVIKALDKALKDYDIEVRLNTNVKSLIVNDAVISGVRLDNKEALSAKSVVLATGGYSYQSTGSTGDGYRFAKEVGHSVTSLNPSLVPFQTEGDIAARMMGLSLRNVSFKLYNDKKKVYDEQGELLFTHFGLSGPLVLTASTLLDSRLRKAMNEGKLKGVIDLKPALDEKQLDSRLLRDLDKNHNKAFKNSLNDLLPSKMIPVIVELSGIDSEKKSSMVTKEERHNLLKLLKGLDFKITSTRGFEEAIITKGGVNVKEIDPSTMESKLIKGLYFSGELIDLDAVTGGYNLQIAWSTGYLAGYSSAFS
ncbi:MAG: NAD(P)/FAD-dependent oxidoreductase [Lachnospiraceae bacterium]|nr:NAD(P)/FAD-dependent oxidoreductase [Lachnospiraceae bacterium]